MEEELQAAVHVAMANRDRKSVTSLAQRRCMASVCVVGPSVLALLITLHGASFVWEGLYFSTVASETLPDPPSEQERLGRLADIAVPRHYTEKVVVATVATSAADSRALLVSAHHAGVQTVVLGRGVTMKWPNNLRAKLVLLRDFLENSQDRLFENDILVFSDGYDTLILGPTEPAIIESFGRAEKALGRSIIVNAEGPCYPGKVFPAPHNDTQRCKYFQSRFEREKSKNKDRWPASTERYLRVNPNSGLYAGRVSALRKLFQVAPIPMILPDSDQAWMQDQIYLHGDLIAIDYGQNLFATYPAANLLDWVPSTSSNGAVLRRPEDGLVPIAAHWQGMGHWCKATSETGALGAIVNLFQHSSIRRVGLWHTPLNCAGFIGIGIGLSWLLSLGWLVASMYLSSRVGVAMRFVSFLLALAALSGWEQLYAFHHNKMGAWAIGAYMYPVLLIPHGCLYFGIMCLR